jgi:DNA-binding transcriptional MerR regulator
MFSVVRAGRTGQVSSRLEARVSWSIVELARMSGVSSRTLRHYDKVGLLPPSGVRPNGYRYYEQDELLRLQQILILRELDLGLRDIAAILDQQHDPLVALRGHYQRLLRERDRLDQVARTVARTIDELKTKEGAPVMTKINRPENLFEGFDPAEYDAEARERWPGQWEQSKRFTDTLTAADTERMQREQTAAMIRMAEFMTAGTDVGDTAVQAEVDAAYHAVAQMWTPNAEAFKKLGQMYVDDPRFTATYNTIAPRLAEYYRDAMTVYAESRLS